MLRNYLTMALRTLRRERGYAVLNLLGLSIGVACFLLIVFYVQFERSYDRFHTDADQIYRVTLNIPQHADAEHADQLGLRDRWARVPVPAPGLIQDHFPEVAAITRLEAHRVLAQRATVQAYEEHFFYTEPAFFEVFDFPLLAGDAAALARPYTVLLTPEAARKYFGTEVPLGQHLRIENEQDYEVVGIVAAAPPNAHFQFDFLASYASRFADGHPADSWNRITYAYLKLRPEVTGATVAAKLGPFSKPHLKKAFNNEAHLGLMPLVDIHLYGQFARDIQPQGDIRYVGLFAVIALLILLIACVNYMNLATARAAKRAKEVGVRKTVGASRGHLAGQFLSESLVLSGAAVLLAFGLVELLLPFYSELMGREISYTSGGMVALVLLATALVVGVLAGSYPAFYLSRFQPVQVLKGRMRGASWSGLRKGLVVFQFTISVALMGCTFVIQQQLGYMQTARMGFEKEQRVVVQTYGELEGRAAAFKEAFLTSPGIQQAAFSNWVPGYPAGIRFLSQQGDVAEYTFGEGDLVIFEDVAVDRDFLETLDMRLLAGRNFSTAHPTDLTEAVVITESLQKRLGWEEPLGKWIKMYQGRKYYVIGVLEDIHNFSMHRELMPAALTLSETHSGYLTVEVAAANLPETLAGLEATWAQFVPERSFMYEFLDAHFAAMYQAEQRLGRLFGWFAGLAVCIACLGFLGLAAFSAERRTKELGIRKVLGASVSGLVGLLAKDFAVLVVVGAVVATPLAYLAMERWLENFAYHIPLGVGVFLSAAVLAFVLALLVVGVQAWRAARANPVEALRYE